MLLGKTRQAAPLRMIQILIRDRMDSWLRSHAACDAARATATAPRIVSIFSTSVRLEYGFARKYVRDPGFSVSYSRLL
jgi:hypothetical protein